MVWRTLGFGGRPNPLVFSRIASVAARSTQALLSSNPAVLGAGRLQLYVDDPVVSVVGTRAQADQAFDLIIAWWLALGVPLSWAKGVMTCGSVPHRWIGIVYHLTPEGAIMRLPEDFVKDLLALIEPACSTTGALPVGDVEIMIGKAARVAHVVPAARPFVAGLWGGLAAAKQARGLGDLSRVPCRRLCHSASWIRALLTEAESCPLRLERLVRPFPPAAEHDLSGHSIEFDASIYGGRSSSPRPERRNSRVLLDDLDRRRGTTSWRGHRRLVAPIVLGIIDPTPCPVRVG